VGECEKITFIIVAAQGQFKAILSGGSAMASAGAATIFGEHWLNVIAKAPFERFVHALNGGAHSDRLLARFGSDCGLAIFYGQCYGIFDSHDARVTGDEFSLIGELAGEVAIPDFFEDKLLASGRAGENNICGNDGELFCGGRYKRKKKAQETNR